MHSLRQQVERCAPLPFVPERFTDETLWSWVTRVALYYGWEPEELLAILTDDLDDSKSYFRDVDIDCEPGEDVLQRLSAITFVPHQTLCEALVRRSSSTLWPDDRIAFCAACWSDSSKAAVPYVHRAWLDAWVVNCSVHKRPLVSVPASRRAARLPDWSVAWSADRGWAMATNVRRRRRSARPAVVAPPNLNIQRCMNTMPAEGLEDSARSESVPAMDEFERKLIMLAGEACAGFSLARAFYDVKQEMYWRNTPEGYNPRVPLREPLGSLAIRACASTLGNALWDLICGTQMRDPDTANPLRRMVSELHGAPRRYLTSRVLEWPTLYRSAWVDLFEWPTIQDVRKVRPDAIRVARTAEAHKWVH